MVPVHESVRRIQLIGKLVVLDELAGEALDRRPVRLEAPQLRHKLPAKSIRAVKPQFIAQDAASQIASAVHATHEWISGRHSLISERVINVAALQSSPGIRGRPAAVKIVSARLDDHIDRDAIRGNIGPVAQALDLRFVERVVVEVIARRRASARMACFNAFRGDVLAPLLAERLELRRAAERAAADIDPPLDTGRLRTKADDAIAARRRELERFSGELCARGRRCHIDDGRSPPDDDRFGQRPNFENLV